MYLDKYFFPFGFTIKFAFMLVKIKRCIINKQNKNYLSYIIVRCDLKNKNKIKSVRLVFHF